MNVLVVEHEDLGRENLCGDLTRLRFVDHVRSADSADAAEQILAEYSPDVVFLDMQLPESGAFRIADRSWPQRIPLIVCTTTFDRNLLRALNRCRAEYLVRPIGQHELAYVVTRDRRPNPVDTGENLKCILDAANFLCSPARGRVHAFRNGQAVFLATTDIAAVRYGRGRFHLWTQTGVCETARPASEIWRNIDVSSFRRVYRNALISTDRARFGRELNRALWWLRRSALLDLILNRPVRSGMAGDQAA